MSSLQGKIAFITGASSGIGRACAQKMAELGANVIIAARRLDALTDLAAQIEKNYGVRVLVIRLDVTDRLQVASELNKRPSDWKQIDILVNNAGLALDLAPIQTGNPEDWDTMLDTNVKGLLAVTQAVVKDMLAAKTGHIVNIGSISSHEVYSGGVVYCASKFAVKAITQGLRLDVHGTGLRVTAVDPGLVATEFSNVRFDHDEKKAKAVYAGMRPLLPEDVADAVVYCVTRPKHVSVAELKLYPTDQSSSQLVHRRKTTHE